MNDFTRGYVDTALWASRFDLDCNESRDFRSLEQAGYTWEEVAPEAQDSVLEDCIAFLGENRHLISRSAEYQAGMDFFLTRNGHGAGFWDGAWPEPDATTLTQAAHNYGSAEFVLGPDDLIYHEG